MKPLLPKSSWVALIGIAFLFPALAPAQTPSFFLNGEGRALGKNTDLKTWADQLSPGWHQGLKPVSHITLPPAFAKKHARPLNQATAYVFSNSKFFCPAPVDEVFLKYDWEKGWSLNYDKDDMAYRKSDEDIEALTHGTDVFCDGSVDIQRLEALNAHNDQFIADNSLTLKQKKELVIDMIHDGFFQPRGASIATDGGTIYNQAEFLKEITEGRWKPDAYPLSQIHYSKLTFAMNFPKENTQVAVMHSSLPYDGSSFLICRTAKGILFYPFDIVGSGVSGTFDQIINWFGDDYIVFSWSRKEATGKSVYKVTESGLEKVGESQSKVSAE